MFRWHNQIYGDRFKNKNSPSAHKLYNEDSINYYYRQQLTT